MLKSVIAQAIFMAGCCITVALGMSCDKRKSNSDVMAQIGKCYQEYLHAPPAEAQQAMLESLRLIDGGGLEAGSAAHSRYLAYARLFRISKSLGHAGEAEAYMICARYWALQAVESDHVTTETAGNRVRETMTTEKVCDLIDEWDRKNTGGVGPAYLSVRGPDHAEAATQPEKK